MNCCSGSAESHEPAILESMAVLVPCPMLPGDLEEHPRAPACIAGRASPTEDA